MKIFISGGAGFIGTNLTSTLLSQKNKVIVYDNLTTGSTKSLPLDNKELKFIKGDVLDYKNLSSSMKGVDIVYHLSANSDVRKGTNDTYLDFRQGIVATHNILEAMRENGVRELIFPSSMTVYGNAVKSPTDETYGPNLPISLYAASKLSAEGLISAYSSMFGIKAWIFRFANVIGPNLTHGVIYDLIHKLVKDKNKLSVLGDGTQTKPYVYTEDIISAILFVQKSANENINIYNVGVNDEISVREIVSIILKKMKLKNAKVDYAKTKAGWVGDVTKFKLELSKLNKLGYSPKYSSSESVEKTVESLLLEIGYKVDE